MAFKLTTYERKNSNQVFIRFWGCLFSYIVPAQTTNYLDAFTGSETNNGTSTSTSRQTLNKVDSSVFSRER